MKIRKIIVICLSALLFAVAGCNALSGEKAENSGAGSAAVSGLSSTSQGLSSSSAPAVVAAPSVSSEPVSSDGKAISKVESKISQNDGEWVAYDTNKDTYKLHIKRTDGTEDKVIVNDPVLAPCVAGEWAYYIVPLQEIDKVKLDGSQKTKVCDIDAMEALNANAAVTAEYKDGYILYKLVQLREIGDSRPNTVTYYNLDLKQNKIIPVKN